MSATPRAPGLGADGMARLREALAGAGYTHDGVLGLLGPAATSALSREEVVPAERATRGGGALETLVRLFALQLPVAESAARAALPLDDCLAGGIAAASGGEVRALLDLRPYAADDADWWVASDLMPGLGDRRPAGPLPADHVLGVGGASTTLAGITVRPPVGDALDLGTGCGVQALHLATHAARVVATDSNPRALAMARLTAGLSGAALDLREGSLFGPVASEAYDLVVSNPPFVVSPRGRFTYRDAGLAGDALAPLLIAQAPAHLRPGGWCQLLANWLHVEGQDWRERLASWIAPTGCDAWVVQREVLPPEEYAETWLRDSGDDRGPHYRELYGGWLDEFDRLGARAVGFGWITLRAGGSDRPHLRLEDVRRPVEQPLGPEVERWFARHDWLAAADDRALLDAPLRAHPRLVLDREARIGGGWTQAQQAVRVDAGLGEAGPIDDFGAAVLAACDGARPLVEALDAAAEGYAMDPLEVLDGALGAVRALVERGLLEPPGIGGGAARRGPDGV
jgi:methylase of polypeptide subunit release factors